MTNRDIAQLLRGYAKLLEYHGENAFKTRSYTKAYDVLRKRDEPVAGLSVAELQGIDGIGKAISQKIVDIVATGRLRQLDELAAASPPGAVELLAVRGLGPKKVRQLIDELAVESTGELLHAIRENRVIALKGFSEKTQDKLREQLEFHQRAQGRARYADVESAVAALLVAGRGHAARFEVTGAFARQCPVVDEIHFLATDDLNAAALDVELRDATAVPAASDTPAHPTSGVASLAGTLAQVPLRVDLVPESAFEAVKNLSDSAAEFLAARGADPIAFDDLAETVRRAAAFAKTECATTPVPQREAASPYPPTPADSVVERGHIRGIVHAHTTWSDGSTPLPVLAEACRAAGYDYLTVTDHSKAAGYAGGLSVERLRAQRREIDEVNARGDGFRVFAGTECDILRDGSLDYPDEVLAELDIVIASIHSVLRMDPADATARVLAAVHHPYVDILGHPTGRLLLSRPGYPVDMEAVLTACAKTGTAIELNASPYRLDLDWRLVGRARELGVPVSINPDAHSLAGLDDVRYGVLAAQKAGLRPEECLNTKSADGFAAWLAARRERAGVAAVSG